MVQIYIRRGLRPGGLFFHHQDGGRMLLQKDQQHSTRLRSFFSSYETSDLRFPLPLRFVTSEPTAGAIWHLLHRFPVCRAAVMNVGKQLLHT